METVSRSDAACVTDEFRRKRKKKILLTVILSLCTICLAALLLHSLGIINLNTPTVSFTQAPKYEVEPYRLSLPDWDTDIFTLGSYLEKPRYINYKTLGSQTVGITDEKYGRYGDGLEFLGQYFDALMHGDHELVNSMHSEEWLHSHGYYEEFTMQKIYDITVELLREYVTQIESGEYITVYDYAVSYKIMKNDGTFRRDIYSDSVRTLYFEVTDNDEELKINRTEYFYWALSK